MDSSWHRAYTYRPDGHLITVEDSREGTSRLTLDAAARVTRVDARDWTETYTYDEAGNQTAATWPETHAAPEACGPRTYTGTRIRSAGRLGYEHDAAGRVIKRRKKHLSRRPEIWHYEWDAEDRLVRATTPDGTVWHYTYDPLARRVSKHSETERVDFTWEGPALIEQTTTGPTPHPVTLTWNHQGLHPISQTERITEETTQREIDTRFFAIVTDLIGTPKALVTEDGAPAWHTHQTLWGTTTWNADATTYTPLRFPGQYFDPETGLHYNYFRHYDPETARYLTPDPLGLGPAPNPVAYVHNPTRTRDPFGLCPEGTAPNFDVDSSGTVRDLRHLGRPDNELVFSGHGGIHPEDRTLLTIPHGTELAMYSRHGESISDEVGNLIETGNPTPLEIYRPGQQVPDYTLDDPDDLHIEGMPRNITVTGPTYLSELLGPNRGRVHWAACRDCS